MKSDVLRQPNMEDQRLNQLGLFGGEGCAVVTPTNTLLSMVGGQFQGSPRVVSK